MVKRFFLTGILFIAAVVASGYTTKSLLPEDIKSVYIAPVVNGIDLSAEISERDRFHVYRPGTEVDVTNAVINRFIFDGNLKVAKEGASDAVITAKLIDYRRDPLRYTEGDDVQEYRLSITLDITMSRASTKEILWHEANLTGDTTFFLTGPRATSEDEAVTKAVEDVARRVVEKTVELW